MHPCLSIEGYLNGSFGFKCIPLGPLVMQVLMFDGPTKRHTFSQHGMEGFYLVPSPEHYRCYTVYVPAMHADRIINTVKLFVHNYPVPKLSSGDSARHAIDYLIEVINDSVPESLFLVGNK